MHNPYAPPVTDEAPPSLVSRSPAADEVAIAEALRRLDEHTADAARMAHDRQCRESRVRPVTWVFGALVPGAVALAPLLGDYWFAAVPLAVLMLIVALALLVVDLKVRPRERATEPVIALRCVWYAAKSRRAGYFLTSLCPTGREQTVPVPALEDYPTGAGSFAMHDKADVKRYLTRWAAAGAGQVRWMWVKGMEVLQQSERVAVVRTRLILQAWPQWANILSLVLFVVVRLIGLIVGVVLYYTLRKRQDLTVDKVLLRAQDGTWYLLDGALRR